MKRQPMQKSNKEDRVTYLGVSENSPLCKACDLVFDWKDDKPTVVLLWTENWLRGGEEDPWPKLCAILDQVNGGSVRLLIAIFAETPDAIGERGLRNGLRALLQALNYDLAMDQKTKGWAQLWDFGRLIHASVDWTKPEGNSAFLQFCKVVSTIRELDRTKNPVPSLTEFFDFLADPEEFRTRILHARPDKATKGLRVLKWLATQATIGTKLSLKVLLVENQAFELEGKNKQIGDGLTKWTKLQGSPLCLLENVEFYLIDKDFEKLRTAKGRDSLRAVKWNPEGDPSNPASEAIPWPEIDLVLQDIVLNDPTRGKGLNGLDLVSHYFEACPQALVFLLTSLNVESLVGSGGVNWKYVDCVLSKDGLAALWYEYRRCFREKFGRMFWQDWNDHLSEPNRKLLRNLFGSLRKWQIEPDILWHGQTLPEMIDHAHRHISALWKLCNDFIGTAMENGGANPDVLSLRHRVAFAAAIWMHDVGHRGDEHVAGSMDIRASHAGISERILLRNPHAYQLGWLIEPDMLPCKTCHARRDDRLSCRNQIHCKAGSDIKLCLLREVGLLCRHHQSNAPLTHNSLTNMAKRGKEPSVYSLLPDPEKPEETEKFLKEMTNEALPMPSPRGTNVRLLQEFKIEGGEHFRSLAGLLRMLDALQLHRARVGTSFFRASFLEFLDMRFGWCEAERVRIEEDRRAATPGRRAYQRASVRLAELDEYEILLRTQLLHFWRQAAVHEVEVRWVWAKNGKASVEVLYALDQGVLKELSDLKTKIPNFEGKPKEFDLGECLVDDMSHWQQKLSTEKHQLITEGDYTDEWKKWVANLSEEVVGPEHKSQYSQEYPIQTSAEAHGYRQALLPDTDFKVGVLPSVLQEGVFYV
jgi:hypothetical protein